MSDDEWIAVTRPPSALRDPGLLLVRLADGSEAAANYSPFSDTWHRVELCGVGAGRRWLPTGRAIEPTHWRPHPDPHMAEG